MVILQQVFSHMPAIQQ
uniref:Uncharacterized protein n=1 Tax=Arundo donax TaxID=35708 RepID=A0A0A9AFQ6_ARUDO